jgi:hypothetical protein
LVLIAGDILLMDISCYHKLENSKKTEEQKEKAKKNARTEKLKEIVRKFNESKS